MNLRGLVRWDEWRDTKVPLGLVALFYAALATPEPGARLLGEMALLLALLVAYGAFGHMINDYSDRQADRVAGKRNSMGSFAPHRAQALIGLSIALGVMPAFYFHDRPGVLALLVACYATAWAYSMPPARFKEREVLGLLASALAQRTLPLLAIFAAFGPWDWVSAAITLAATLVGLRYILVHQLIDHAADHKARLRTFVTVNGRDRAIRLIRILFPLEAASLAVAVLGMVLVAPALILLAVLYPVLLLLKGRALARIGKPYTPVSYALFNDIYSVYLPLSLALVVAARSPVFLPALLLTLLIQLKPLRNEGLQIRALARQFRGKS